MGMPPQRTGMGIKPGRRGRDLTTGSAWSHCLSLCVPGIRRVDGTNQDASLLDGDAGLGHRPPLPACNSLPGVAGRSGYCWMTGMRLSSLHLRSDALKNRLMVASKNPKKGKSIDPSLNRLLTQNLAEKEFLPNFRQF